MMRAGGGLLGVSGILAVWLTATARVRAEEGKGPGEAAAARAKPCALFYHGFEDLEELKKDSRCQVRGGTIVPGRVGSAVRGLNMVIAKPEAIMDVRRGTFCCWFQVSGPGETVPVDVWPGRPAWELRIKLEKPKTEQGKPDDPQALAGTVGFKIVLGETPRTGDGNVELEETVQAEIACKPGDWVHVAWTWAGLQHRLYVNGQMRTEKRLVSAFPPQAGPAMRFGGHWLTKVQHPLDEMAFYNVALTPEEVKAIYERKQPGPAELSGKRGLTLTTAWGPGERKVHVSADAGNDLEERAVAFRMVALDEQDRKLGEETLNHLRRGFGEALIPLSQMPPGSYRVRVEALDAQKRVLETKESVPWKLVEAPWIGNTLGLSEQVQPPWTPIKVGDEALEVWGRTYVLKGGFGLPAQISSQGRKLLAAPVALTLVQDGKPLPVANVKLKLTDATPAVARWEGSARAGDVEIVVRGRLEYDGMMLLNLNLKPAAGSARLDAVDLDTVLPGERALFLNTSTEQGFWWHPYRSWVPETPGVFHDNLRQKATRVSFLPFVVFSDHDVALEWFADKRAGWNLDYAKPSQIMSKDENGDVRLKVRFANAPFVLERAVDIEFGYDATPVKPLPADWRTAYVHHHSLPLKHKSDLALWWSWPDDAGKKARQGTFNVCARDPEGYAKAFESSRQSGIKIVPFTNQHVLDSHNKEENELINRTMADECGGSGWVALPTRGVRDYWAWNVDCWIKRGGIEGIYVDEANDATCSGHFLGGSGYIKPDGTRGVGHNTLGMREQLKRVRQLFVDNGKRPVVWIPVYAHIIPHAHAFVDVASEGEAYMFEKPDGADWIDQWGKCLLERKSGPGAVGGPWLLSLGRAQKFGFIPIFLNYIKFYNKPEFPQAVRAMHGLLGLLDIIPICQDVNVSFVKAKDAFGIGEPDVEFHGYWEQKEVSAAREDVKASYYKRKKSALIIVTNLGKEPFEGEVRVAFPALGLDLAKTTLKDAEAPEPVLRAEDLAKLKIRGHDYRLVWLEESQ